MTFSACNLLSSVKTALQTAFRSLDGLAIYNRGTRLRLFPVSLSTHSRAQGLVHLLPQDILSPQAEIMIDGLPRRQVAGHHSPGTAALQNVENAIQNHAPAVSARPTSRRFAWQVWSNFQPLGIIQVGRVNLLSLSHHASLPDFPYVR